MTDAHDEDETRPRTLTNWQVLGFIARRWWSQPARFVGLTSLFLVCTACEISIPWAAGALIDAVADPARLTHLAWKAWAGLVGVYVLYYAARMLAFRMMSRFTVRNMARVVTDGYARVQAFSADWHASSFAGSTVRKVSRAMWGLDTVTDAVILSLIPTAVVLTALSVSIGIRWTAAGLLAGGVTALFILANLVATRWYIRPANLVSNRLDTRIGGALADAISGNPAVKGFGAEAREEARFAAVAEAWRAAMLRTWTKFNNLAFVTYSLMICLQAGMSGLMLWAWTQGKASAGDVAFAVTSFMLMQTYLRNFNEMTRNLQRGLDDVLDVAQFLRTPPQLADRDGAPAFIPAEGEIVFERVGFGYRNQAGALYRDFSLRIAPGEKVALVGPTGSGKSTFVKLLQRLYDVDEGRILIDGQDIASVTQGSLRRAIAVVPQDPALFHRSIAENIAYGRPEASPEEIALAARRARADGFIEALPRGYETLVGERGVKLSGGERQRVAIARAFLADAPILVLDEATSSLDVETERQVQAATQALMAGRTTVVIAHRLSTVRGADRILVFEAGGIVEEGRHADLLARGGAYARLHAVMEAG